MPSVRLTLVNNAKQTQKSAVILKVDDNPEAVDRLISDILTLAKNKLRLKKAKTLYLNHGAELTDPTWLANGRVSQDSVIYVSCGEAYVGQTRTNTAASLTSLVPNAELSTSGDNQEKSLEGADKTQIDAVVEKVDALALESEMSATIAILAKKSYVDPDANAQLNRTAMLPGMLRVIGQPDLHPGNQYPIGATFITQKLIYPALIGNDIGCGMAVYKTRLSSNIKPQKIVDKMHQLEGRWTEGDPHAFLISQLGEELAETGKTHLDQLGTLGGGNHFAEFVVVEKQVDQELCDSIGITDDKTYLIVHSGSRRFGQTVLETFNSSQNKAEKKQLGIEADSKSGLAYLKQHDLACSWARTNRELIAHRVLTRLNAEENAEKILDIWHNNVEQKIIESVDTERPCWVHRKGAAPSDRGLVVIPGSRGHFSYLVMPHGGQEKNGFSLAHGAGRLLPRAKALQKRPQTSKQASISALQTTSLGSSVICEDSDLLFEEQPDAYKEITDIIDDLGPFVKVVAILRPICTYKMRNEKRT
ncbi:hypothetical protein EDD11_003998 [Mortierella claussenii]|nr:hypothetical protein EDD11_003998 [Mortierella claussenii]